jgi:ABC-type amino acid transport substrate-binding protein
VNFIQIILVIVISFITAFGTISYLNPLQIDKMTPGTAHETSYERVVRTNTLRCGYQYWDGAIMRNEKTGELYGPWIDMMNAIAAATGLKIEWSSQVAWSDVGAALKANKIDGMCAGMWTSAAKAKEINFTVPLAYQAVEAFVRANDHRFDFALDTLNHEQTTIAVIENDNSDFIAKQDFPLARRDILGQSFGTDGDLLMDVKTKKADVTFTVAGLWQQFEKNNPNQIRRLSKEHQLRVFGLALAVNNDDQRLLQLLNSGEQEVQNSGMLDKILDKANQAFPDMYIKPIKPFP